MAQPRRAGLERRSADDPDRDIAAMVDLGRRDCGRALGCCPDTDTRTAPVPGFVEASDFSASCGTVCPRRCWNAVVGRRVERASLCGGSDRQIAGAAAAVLSFRAIAARVMGFHRLSGFLCSADGGVLGCRLRPQFHPQARGRRTRNLRQELYRSKSGICAVRRGAGLSGQGVGAKQQAAARRPAHGCGAGTSSPTCCSSSLHARRWLPCR